VYSYRLKQVDKDGASSCETISKVITLTYNGEVELALEQNIPNPVVNHTAVTFTVPAESYTKLEVIDVYGNVVKTLVNASVNGTQTIEWNATDNNNNNVASGSYILRLTSGDQVRTVKMTVVK
jgi:flagellar hook assembly protein FlgD